MVAVPRHRRPRPRSARPADRGDRRGALSRDGCGSGPRARSWSLSGAGTRALLALVLVLAAPPLRAGDVKPGAWNRNVPTGWVVVETDHYQVQSQIGEEAGRLLGEHLEAMLEVYRDMLPFRKRMPTFVLKVFRDREGFLEYYPRGQGAAAYYDKRNKELVGYHTGKLLGELTAERPLAVGQRVLAGLDETRRSQLEALLDRAHDAYLYDLADVLSHEGWHQYFHYYTVSWVTMPSWLDEGLGDYFFMARRADQGQGVVLGELNHYRLRVLRQAFLDGTTVTFGRMLDFEQQDYYSNPSVFYAQGWSMVHFLMQHEEQRYRELIPKLIKHFKGSKNFRKSTERIFKGLNLDELDSAWIGWALRLDPDDPLHDLAEEFGAVLPPEELVAPARWRDAYTRRWTELHGDPDEDGQD